MRYLILVFLTVLSFSVTAQSDCKVKLSAISGTYSGDCKKGFADGKGKAVGTDQYEGEFKKGLPHGKGIYTWSNGDRYEGEFKKGKKNGEGKLTVASAKDSVIVGFWENDEYIGKYKKPYVIFKKDKSILNVKVDYYSADQMMVEVILVVNGIVKTSPILDFSSKVGRFGTIQQKPRSARITNVEYPFRATINGLDIEFFKSGYWKLRIESNKQ